MRMRKRRRPPERRTPWLVRTCALRACVCVCVCVRVCVCAWICVFVFMGAVRHNCNKHACQSIRLTHMGARLQTLT